MTAMTDKLENLIGDWYFRGVVPTLPANLYFGLMTAAPGETGPGTEVTGPGYARVSVARALASFNGTHGNTTGNSTGTNGLFTNAVTLAFNAPSGAWGTITHWGVFTAQTGGDLHWYGPLDDQKTVNANDAAPQIQPGQGRITIDN